MPLSRRRPRVRVPSLPPILRAVTVFSVYSWLVICAAKLLNLLVPTRLLTGGLECGAPTIEASVVLSSLGTLGQLAACRVLRSVSSTGVFDGDVAKGELNGWNQKGRGLTVKSLYLSLTPQRAKSNCALLYLERRSWC